MKVIRAVMTVFLLMVLTIVCLGWNWSADLPSPKSEGARVAFGVTAFSAVVGLGLLWSAKPRRSE